MAQLKFKVETTYACGHVGYHETPSIFAPKEDVVHKKKSRAYCDECKSKYIREWKLKYAIEFAQEEGYDAPLTGTEEEVDNAMLNRMEIIESMKNVYDGYRISISRIYKLSLESDISLSSFYNRIVKKACKLISEKHKEADYWNKTIANKADDNWTCQDSWDVDYDNKEGHALLEDVIDALAADDAELNTFLTDTIETKFPGSTWQEFHPVCKERAYFAYLNFQTLGV